MSQHTGSADDEGIQLIYSSLPPGKRLHAPPAAPHDGAQARDEPGPIRGSRDSWPHPYHRVLNVTFLGALFALGILLGTVVSGYAASLRSSSTPLRPSLHTPTTLATVLSDEPVAAATLDARFAIVTLGIRCLRDTCDGSGYMPASQRVYALQGGWSCTTTTPMEVVDRRLQHVYCRLDQPNVYTAAFDGAPFFCAGSRLGCHFVMQVQTTNGR